MSVSNVSSGGAGVHPDSSAEAWVGGVISAAEQQALGWREFNFEEEAANTGNAQQTDGVDRGPPTAHERALDAFWGSDPNRPPSSLPSSSQAEGKKIDTVLDQKVEDLLDMSPSLRRLWEIAKNAGWELEMTNEGKSRAEAGKPPRVLINPADIKEGGDPFAKMASLVSHEMGHAGTPYQPRIEADNMADFVSKNVVKDLRHEGAAAFVNARTRDEIIAAGGPDIGIRGGLDEWYISVYEDYKAGRISESQAIDRMAN